MESSRKKTEWSSAHAQLWTTFKRSGSNVDVRPSEHVVDSASPPQPSTAASPPRSDVSRLERRILLLEREIESRDAREAKTIDLIAKAVSGISNNGAYTKEFTDVLEERISGASTLAFADAASELLTSLGLLEGRIRTLGEAKPMQEVDSAPLRTLCEVVGGPAFSSRCNTCSDAAMALSKFLEEMQGGSSPSRRQPLTAALASAPPSSLAGLLRVSASRMTSADSRPIADSSQLDLRRVVDLLGGDSQNCETLGLTAAELALAKCRDLEESRRDVGTLSIVIAEFERAAHRSLRNVGVGILPTVKQIRAQLSGSEAAPSEPVIPASKGGEEGPEWIGKRIAQLTKSCQDAAAKHNSVDPLAIPPRQGPRAVTADTDAKVCRRAVDDSITLVDDTLRSLVSTNTHLKEVLQRILTAFERFFNFKAFVQGPKVSFAQDAPLPILLDRCEAVLDSAKHINQTIFDMCGPIVTKLRSPEDQAALSLHDTCSLIGTAIENLNRAAECSNMSPDELARLGEVFSTLSIELDSRWPSVRELLLLDGAEDLDGNNNPIERVFVCISSMLLHIPRLKEWIRREKASAEDIVHNAMQNLSQLIVPLHTADVAVAPPVETLDELVTALHDRFSALQLHQSRHHGRVHSVRQEHLRLEELVNDSCHRWAAQLKKMLGNSDFDGAVTDEAEQGPENSNPESAIEKVEAVIQSTRSRLSKLISTQKADRVRMENYQSSHDAWNRKWQQILSDSNGLATALGVQLPADGPRLDDPRQILKQCADFVVTQGCFSEASTSAATIQVLRELNTELSNEKLKTEGAIDHITERLIEIARIMKHALFSVGCDEEAVDEEIENAKYDNEPLACVLSKLARWVVRLDENINHLVDENKMIVKYFAAIHKHISPEQAEVHDSNLLDMKDTLLLLTQHVLDSVDQWLSGPSKVRSSDSNEDPRYRSELLGHDDRLARIHAAICKVNSAMEGIKRVTYLGLPNGLVDDASPTRQGVGFIDVDLAAMSNDDLLRIVEKNATFIKNSIATFGSSFKHINILVQKDVDSMQQCLCEIFGTLSEIELEKAFPINRDEMFDVYRLMSERSTRQKGQYFFQGGDQVAPWVLALKILSGMFPAMIDKLHDRIKRLAEVYGTLEKIAVSVCRCRAARGELLATVPAPVKSNDFDGPMPTSTEPQDAVTFNVSDEELVEMVDDICRSAAEGSGSKTRVLEDECSRLQEQLQVLQETVAVSERKLQTAQSFHAEEKSTVELERDRALSEAAMLRSQLRRATRSASSHLDHRQTPQKRDITAAVAGGDSENAAIRKAPPRKDHNAIAAMSPAIPLSAVEAYMRNLQKELQNRHLIDSTARPMTPKGGHSKKTTKLSMAHVATSPSPSRARHPHTMLSSPVRSADSRSAAHGDDCDTCEKRARSASRSRSAPRAVVFNIPGVNSDDAKNRHSSVTHYTTTTPFNTNALTTQRSRSPKPQHHVVVVTPGERTPQRSTNAKARGADTGRPAEQPPRQGQSNASPHRLANLDSDGMQKLVGAVSKR